MLVFFTGAGVSTESGIPDYRGPNGLWRRDPDAAKLVSFENYVGDPAVRRRSWQFRRDSPAWDAQPNAAHLAMARCGQAWVITQNVDGLHQRSGTSPARVLELHGNIFATVCVACGDRASTREALDRIEQGDADPACRLCGGVLKTDTVMFGQNLDAGLLARAVEVASSAETFVVVGSSLVVTPAASLVGIAANAGARVIIVNREPTPYDDVADLVIRESIGIALPALCAAEGWAE